MAALFVAIALSVGCGERKGVGIEESFETLEDTPLIVRQAALLSSVSAGAERPIASISKAPIAGSVDLRGEGAFVYEPAADFVGTDRFEYQLRSAGELLGTSAVSIAVQPVDDAPVAVSMVFSAIPGVRTTRKGAGMMRASYDPDGDELSVEVVAGPSKGKLDWNPGGGFSYLPDASFEGSDAFTFVVSDGDLVSQEATGRITYPNVLLVVADDIGQGDIGAYNSGSALKLPNIDALADHGVRFTRAHAAAALCSPSRYSVLTGNYTYRSAKDRGIWSTYSPKTMIPPDQDTLAHVLRAAGYRTAQIGKLHNGGAFWNTAGTGYTKVHSEIDFTRPYDAGPTQFGFDRSFSLPGGVSTSPYAYFEDDRLVRRGAGGVYEAFSDNLEAHGHFVEIEDGYTHFNGGSVGQAGPAMDNYDSRAVGATLARQSLDFLEEHWEEHPAEAYSPFFLYLATPAVHAPLTPPKFFNPQNPKAVNGPGGVRIRGATPVSDRTDMVYEVDAMLGAIVARLREERALDDTLIVFTSDNGVRRGDSVLVDGPGDGNRVEYGHSANHYNPQGVEDGIPLRAYKGLVYEGGHRVPLIVRWGSGQRDTSAIAPGSTSDRLVGLQDLMASLAGLLGLELAPDQGRDSFSFAPTLLGADALAPERTHMIVQGSPKSAGDSGEIDRAYYERDARGELWKLSLISDADKPLERLRAKELFNLTQDPGETKDLVGSGAASPIVEGMFERYVTLLSLERTVP